MAIELAEYLDRETGVEEQEGFVIDTEQKANWALRKIKQLQDKMEANTLMARTENERVTAWLKEVSEPLQRDIDFFTGLLEQYHREVIERDPKAKTIKLPHGNLKMRVQQPEFRRDENKLLAWLKKTDRKDYIVVKESPAWAELKKVLKVVGTSMADPETGEVVDGVEVVEREPKFSVEV